MLRNLESARQALNTAFESIQILEDSIAKIGEQVPENELKAYKVQVGHVMSEIFDRIIKPVLIEHPELTPESYKEWFQP